MFWEIFQKLCKEKNTSPTEVMKTLGLSTSKVTAWKKGSMPNGKILSAIADYFAVSIDYLLGRISTEKRETHFSDVPTHKLYNSNDYHEEYKCSPYVICYIDFLGTKKAMLDTPNKTIATYKEIYKIIIKVLERIITRDEFPTVNEIEYKIFSDNMIIAAKYDINNKEDLNEKTACLSMACAMFQYGVLASCGILLRGGICTGSLYFDNTFVMGPGLVSAYVLENYSALYPRIVVDPKLITCIGGLNANLSDKYKSPIIYDDFEDTKIYYLNYLLYSRLYSGDNNKEAYKQIDNIDTINFALISIENATSDIKVLRKIRWAKYYHKQFCESKSWNCIFQSVSINDFLYQEDDAKNLYEGLDATDQAEIRGEMKQMLKAEKYKQDGTGAKMV